MSISLLLADDSITIQKVIGIIFGGDEFSLTVVDNGKSAVEKARELQPDVMLIDVLMPGMTGYEVTEAIRAIPEIASKPVLLLTGSFEPFDEEKARRCGADDFIAKPFESQEIIGKVKELAARGSKIQAPPVAAQSQPVEMEPAAPEPQAPSSAMEVSDVWGAFEFEEETSSHALLAPEQVSAGSVMEDTDVFEMVSGIPETISDPEAAGPQTEQQAPAHSIGSSWVPVEEQTFDFNEPLAPSAPAETVPASTATAFQEISFGDISFGEELQGQPAIPPPSAVESPREALPAEETPAVQPTVIEEAFSSSLPAFSEPDPPTFSIPDPPVFDVPSPEAVVEQPQSAPLSQTSSSSSDSPTDVLPTETTPPLAPEAAVPVVDIPPPPVSTAVSSGTFPAQLSEDQLKAALASVSKEVIERIVWEVVPDLAEAMVKEAIRKIKDGA